MEKTLAKLALAPGLTGITIALRRAKQHEIKSSTGENAAIKRLAKIRCMWHLPTNWGESLQTKLLIYVTNGIREDMSDATRALIKNTVLYPVS